MSTPTDISAPLLPVRNGTGHILYFFGSFTRRSSTDRPIVYPTAMIRRMLFLDHPSHTNNSVVKAWKLYPHQITQILPFTSSVSINYFKSLLRSTVGRTSVLGRRAFTVLRSTCSWRVAIYVGKPSAAGQPTRPTQSFILSGSINWVVSKFIGCALVASSGHQVKSGAVYRLTPALPCVAAVVCPALSGGC